MMNFGGTYMGMMVNGQPGATLKSCVYEMRVSPPNPPR
jgi:hypothetical protein